MKTIAAMNEALKRRCQKYRAKLEEAIAKTLKDQAQEVWVQVAQQDQARLRPDAGLLGFFI